MIDEINLLNLELYGIVKIVKMKGPHINYI
jgi:hypothetical protein